MSVKESRPLAGLLLITVFLLISTTDGFSAQSTVRMRSGIGASVIVPPRGCTIITSRILFNSEDFGKGSQSDGSISVRCDRGVTYGIGLSSGMHSTPVSRRMKSDDDNYLLYSLFQDKNRYFHWGSGLQFGPTKTSIGNGGRQIHKIYGSTEFSENQVAGTFADQIAVTINY